MKTFISINGIAFISCFLAGALLFFTASKTYARPVIKTGNIQVITEDTSKQDIDKNKEGAQRIAFEKSSSSLQRRNLLDKLSKMPPQDPEVFSSAKEEYLWFEKAKEDGDEYEKAIKQLNDLLRNQNLW